MKLSFYVVHYIILHPFQTIRRFVFSKLIRCFYDVSRHIVYIYVHDKYKISRKAKISYNLEQMEYVQAFNYHNTNLILHFASFS